MGKFDFQFDTELTKKIERLSNFDEIAVDMLTEASPILLSRVKNEVGKHKDTGDLYASIKLMKKPKKNQYGWFISVIPTGTDSKGVRNMEKLAHLEYGTSKIAPKPILTKALEDARDEVGESMQNTLNKWVNK